MSTGDKLVVTKIEQIGDMYRVTAKDADTTLMKRRNVTSMVGDATPYRIGGLVEVALRVVD